MNFDYEGARREGYTDEEIKEFLSSQSQTRKPSYETFSPDDSAFTKIAKNFKNFFGNLGNPVQEEPKQQFEESPIDPRLLKNVPNFDVQGALEEGYTPEEINEFLEENQPQRSALEKGGRIAAQYGLGRLEGSAPGMAYDVAVAPLASKEAQNIPYRESLGDELESLMEKKAAGQWTPEDQALYDHITEQILDPRKSMEFAQAEDLSIRGLAEKATGVDLHPEGILEKAANWTGFIKSTKNAKNLINLGTSPKQISSILLPGAKDVVRGLTAGTALQMAANNQLGPLGTMAAAVVGDLAGGGIAGIAKAVTHPKQTLAKGFSLISNTKSAIRNDLKEAAEGMQFTKDIGTLTDNNMVQMIQARLAASGLIGRPLENLRKQMTKEITEAYESVAKELGESRFKTMHEAGEVTQQVIKKMREADLKTARELYEGANKALMEGTKGAFVSAEKLANKIRELENELRPGAVKSSEQKAVLDYIDKLKSNLYDEAGNLRPVRVKDLMNNKIALNDIINYEVQGGAKQLLKGIVNELDRTIISHGKNNPTFAKNYINANRKFSEHAKNFRNKGIEVILKSDPENVLNKMNTTQGRRDLRNALSKTPEGKKLFNELARTKMDNMFGMNMKDGMVEQLKNGKFISVMKNPKNRQLLKEVLSPEAYKRLLNLEKHVGQLQETAQKFFNASQSATAAADLAMTGTLLSGVASMIMGNPWALNAIGLFAAGKGLSKLIADPEFLKMVEEAIKVSKKDNISLMKRVSDKIINHTQETIGPAILTARTNQQEEMAPIE